MVDRGYRGHGVEATRILISGLRNHPEPVDDLVEINNEVPENVRRAHRFTKS